MTGNYHKFLLLITRTLCVFLLIVFLFGCNKESVTAYKPKENLMISKADKFYFIGLEETVYSGEQNKQTVLKAKSVIHKKKRLGFLSLNFLDVIEATDVTVTTINKESNIHESKSAMKKNDDLYTVINKGVSNLKLEHNIAELIIDKVRIDFINYKAISSLSAGKLTVDALKQKLVFDNGLKIESPSQNKLIAKNAVWHNKNKKLYIPGRYVIKKDELIIDSGSQSFLSINDGKIMATK